MTPSRTPAWHAFGCSLILLACLAGCGRRPIELKIPVAQMIQGQTMGTTFTVKFIATSHTPTEAAVTEAVAKELELVNAQMSTYIASSEISQFNNSLSTDWFPVSAETAEVVQLALDISEQTQGAFDVTVGPLVDLWGFGPSGRKDTIPPEAFIADALKRCGYTKLQVRRTEPALRKQIPTLRVDLSGIAKGHGVDRVAAVMEGLGITSYFVEIGGEVRAAGKKAGNQPWRVGIEKPVEDVRDIQTAIDISDRALATSGNYRTFYELDGQKLWHTIDPRTGRPTTQPALSATVIASSCAQADALATALMVLGAEAGTQLADASDWSAMITIPPSAGSTEPGIICSADFQQDANSTPPHPAGANP